MTPDPAPRPDAFLDDETEAALAERDRAAAHAREAEHLRIGRLGEDLACKWLWRRGFRILRRNFRAGRDELDIIAERRGRIHIVEVKTRTGDALGEPEDRVDEDKRRSLRNAASLYLAEFREAPRGGMQFDIFAQVLDDAGRPVRQELIEGAL